MMQIVDRMAKKDVINIQSDPPQTPPTYNQDPMGCFARLGLEISMQNMGGRNLSEKVDKISCTLYKAESQYLLKGVHKGIRVNN